MFLYLDYSVCVINSDLTTLEPVNKNALVN